MGEDGVSVNEERVLRVDVAEPRRDKNGVPMTHIEYVVDDEDFSEDNGVRIFREYSHKNDQSMGWLREVFESALGPIQGDEAGDIDLEESDLIGKLVVGLCFNETYQGRVQARVGAISSLESDSDESDPS